MLTSLEWMECVGWRFTTSLARDDRDSGDGHRLLLWSTGTMMPSRFATPSTTPGKTGPSCRKSNTGGRQRGASPPSDQKTRFAGFAVRTWQCGQAGRKPGQRGPVRDSGNAEGANLGAYRVCRFAPRPHEKRPGTKTQCWRGVAADSPPGLQKSAHKRIRFGDRRKVSTGGGVRPLMVKNRAKR